MAEIDNKTHDRTNYEDDIITQSMENLFKEEVDKLNGTKPEVEEVDEKFEPDVSVEDEIEDALEPKAKDSDKVSDEEAESRLISDLLGDSKNDDNETAEDTDGDIVDSDEDIDSEDEDDSDTDSEEEASEDSEEEESDDTELKGETEDDDNQEDEDEHNPHESKRWERRVKNIKRKIRDEVEAEYNAKIEQVRADASKQLEESQTNEPSQEIMNEYLMLKRKYDVENDPTITEKYQSRIEANEATARNILKKYYKPEMVDKIGNVADFAQQHPAEWQDAINSIKDANPLEAETLVMKAVDTLSAVEEKNIEINKASESAIEYFNEQKEIQKRNELAMKEQQEQRANEINQYKTQVFESKDFNLLDPSSAKTEEETQRIIDHNKTATLMRENFSKMLESKTVAEEIDIRMAASLAFKFKAELDKAKSEIKTLKEKRAKRAKVGQVGRNRTQSNSFAQPKPSHNQPASTDELFATAAKQYLGQ